MRQCYRLKKLSTFSKQRSWKHAGNYVAKKYMESVDRSVYFEDVKLQMDAKLWGDEYNRHNPPKKIDIFQMYVIELVREEGSPLFHLEHFIEVGVLWQQLLLGKVKRCCVVVIIKLVISWLFILASIASLVSLMLAYWSLCFLYPDPTVTQYILQAPTCLVTLLF